MAIDELIANHPSVVGSILNASKQGNVKLQFTPMDRKVLDKTYPVAAEHGGVVLKHGDFVMERSHGIIRYFAAKAGLIPSDPLQAALVDELLEGIIRVRAAVGKSDDDHTIKATVKALENQAGSKGFAVGSKLSIIDFELAELFAWLSAKVSKLIERKDYPKLDASASKAIDAAGGTEAAKNYRKTVQSIHEGAGH